jgi:hypothetical protein
MSTDYMDLSGPRNWLSGCCGAVAFGELHDAGDGEKSGICSVCKDHATFTKSEDEE